MFIMEYEIDREGFDRLPRKFREDPKPVMNQVAKRLVGAVKRHLEQDDHAPLSPVTLQLRKQANISGSKPLIATGRMLGGIRFLATADEAVAIVPFPGGPLHHGFTTSPASMIPNKEVPARPFAYLDDADIEGIMDEIEGFYFAP